MQFITFPPKNTWSQLLRRPAMDTSLLEQQVHEILATVKRNGDEAVRNYVQRFDQVTLDTFEVSAAEIDDASRLLDPALKEAILLAKRNIETFHKTQMEPAQKTETMPGVSCWRMPVAIDKVGLYIPGGSAPLFSTVLMLGVPAQLAGCREVVLCTPCGRDGKVHPAILFTATLVGITRIFKIGGAQAIAAMAYGTSSVPQVYKIFGPGNQYVTCAKQLVLQEGVAIDMPAGPSEVAILADETCVPAFVAADLLSQAEHGPDSQVLLVSSSKQVIRDVVTETERQLGLLPRKGIAAAALNNSRAILVSTLDEAMELLNAYSPEHLIIACRDAEALCRQVRNAGSVFLGNYTPESAGDYASGTNHTLPTNGYARAYSGVSLDSFVKKITVQQISPEGLQQLGHAIERMAEAEGLQAHKQAVSLRLACIKTTSLS